MVHGIIILMIIITYCGGLSSGKRKMSVNRFSEMEEYDSMAVTRCDAVCLKYKGTERKMCHNQCLDNKGIKPGTCPENFAGVSVFAQACLNVCEHDYLCPNIEKCCKHSCGVTCQTAVNLKHAGLPDIPLNVSAKEIESEVEIQWGFPLSNPNNRGALFLIEAKSHFGRYLNEESLGSWIPIFETPDNPAVIKGLILAAHWYVFRVAAVNTVGSQGYSTPSAYFFLSKKPSKPGRPKRLGVTKVQEVNGTVRGDLRWGHPRSDVPIKRYKIFWSRRLPGFNPRNASDSVLVHQRTVAKGKPRFELRDLEKNELYFIQVQAIANYGREKIKGAKAELFFNTSLLHDQSAEQFKRRHQNHNQT